MTKNLKGWAIVTSKGQILVLHNAENKYCSSFALFKTVKEAKKVRTILKQQYKVDQLSIKPALIAILPDSLLTRKKGNEFT